MYEVNANAANTQDIGLGKGGSQVFDPIPYINIAERRKAQIAAEQAKKKQHEEDKLNLALKGLGDKIFDRDREVFAKKQDEIKNQVYKNADKLSSGDTGAWLELNSMINNYQQDAALSNEAGKQWLVNQHEISKAPAGTYREEGVESVNKFNSPDYAGNYDVSNMKPQKSFDMGHYITNELVPKTRQDIGADGRVKDLGAKEADEIIATQLQDPIKFEEMDYRLNKMSEPELNSIGLTKDPKNTSFKQATPISLAQETYRKQLLYHSVAPAPQVPQWKQQEFEPINTNPVTVKINSVKKGGEVGESNASSIANITHATPVRTVNPTTTTMRTVEGAKLPKGVEVNEVTFGQTAVMPVWKTGTLEGNIVSDQVLEKGIKEGKVEYKPITFGIAQYSQPDEFNPSKKIKQTTNIYQDASENQGALKKQGKVNLPELQKIADKKNSEIGGKKEAEKIYTVKGKTHTASAIEKAAKASSMSVQEYLKEVNK